MVNMLTHVKYLHILKQNVGNDVYIKIHVVIFDWDKKKILTNCCLRTGQCTAV